MQNKFVLLAILDGWGIAPKGPGNAITQAKTPNMNRLWAAYPHTQLEAAGQAVGLPRGEAGNTETGHLNLGAGRIVYQDLARINMAIADGTFFKNQTLLNAINHVKKNNSKLHLMGLIGAGGVHSSMEHLFALIQLAAKHQVKNTFIHAFTDGRDSPPNAGITYVSQLENILKKEGVGQIASIMGRYWAMDRDQRWDRTAKAYLALTKGTNNICNSPQKAIENSYSAKKSDEFIDPCLIADQNQKPKALIKQNDAVIFFNFRIDRPRQLTRAFILDDLKKAASDWDFDPYAVEYEKTHKPKAIRKINFERGEKIKNLYFVTMTEYGKVITDAGAFPAFPPEIIEMPLGRVISTHDLRQLRVSESEKERFVTFYFDGQRSQSFTGEEKLIIPSPGVTTYDLKPEMSALLMTEALLQKLKSDQLYSFVLINYANVDMVGHTGNLEAAKKAIETVDFCIGKLTNYILSTDGTLLITADHGNAEEIINQKTNQPDTEHTVNPVPFIVVSKQFAGVSQTLQSGILSDIAPTVLALMGLQKPTQMTSRNLLAPLMVKK